jgi:hypothetical protein
MLINHPIYETIIGEHYLEGFEYVAGSRIGNNTVNPDYLFFFEPVQLLKSCFFYFTCSELFRTFF